MAIDQRISEDDLSKLDFILALLQGRATKFYPWRPALYVSKENQLMKLDMAVNQTVAVRRFNTGGFTHRETLMEYPTTWEELPTLFATFDQQGYGLVATELSLKSFARGYMSVLQKHLVVPTKGKDPCISQWLDRWLAQGFSPSTKIQRLIERELVLVYAKHRTGSRLAFEILPELGDLSFANSQAYALAWCYTGWLSDELDEKEARLVFMCQELKEDQFAAFYAGLLAGQKFHRRS